MPPDAQRAYLDAAMTAPRGTTIRFSTHPRCVTDERLALVAPYPISMIELGISSLDDDVLSACGRGYEGSDALSSVSRLLDLGFGTGVQLMIGLPRQTPESSLEDLRLLAAVKGPRDMALRIYPTLVLPGTDLDGLCTAGSYEPLGISRAIEWTAVMVLSALDLGFSPQRIGLAETESLKASRPKGPYHPAFGEFAWAESLSALLARNSATGPWAVSERAFSILHSHAAFGVRKLAERTGNSPALVRSHLRFPAAASRNIPKRGVTFR
jgi:hypothetical protein